MKPFIYVHELLSNNAGVWIGCDDREIVEKSHVEGETGKDVIALYKRPFELAVWYGKMPESNGKTNWTAILYRKGDEDTLFGGLADGFTIDRSEYPDRVRYEADRVRYLIGEIEEEPFILDYDAELHSGYVGIDE